MKNLIVFFCASLMATTTVFANNSTETMQDHLQKNSQELYKQINEISKAEAEIEKLSARISNTKSQRDDVVTAATAVTLISLAISIPANKGIEKNIYRLLAGAFAYVGADGYLTLSDKIEVNVDQLLQLREELANLKSELIEKAKMNAAIAQKLESL